MFRTTPTQFRLADLELFAGTSKSELRAASALLTPVTVGAGEVLFRQGAIGDEFMIISDGLVNIIDEEGDQPHVLAVAATGDVLGEMSLLHHTRRSATVVTLVPTTVYVGTPREFYALMEVAPTVADKIVRAADARREANATALVG